MASRLSRSRQTGPMLPQSTGMYAIGPGGPARSRHSSAFPPGCGATPTWTPSSIGCGRTMTKSSRRGTPAFMVSFLNPASDGAVLPILHLNGYKIANPTILGRKPNGSNTRFPRRPYLLRQFSFPGGIPSHAAPETPGSIHEGGELGYALAHAYGAAFDNLDLI